MLNRFCKKPLYEVTRTLANVAMGAEKAQLVIRNAKLVNVCGPEGVRAMTRDAKRSPLKAISNVPSCVPAVAGFEDTGSEIGPEEVQEMMTWDGIMGLGEMMSFQNVIDGDARMHDELARTLRADQVITGHYPVPDTGAGLNAYIASGVRCCHESTRPRDVLEKMRHGMYALMRYGSVWQEMPTIIHAILDNQIDDRFACHGIHIAGMRS